MYKDTIMESKTGFLEIIVGPMFSGKTTHLVDLYEKYTASGVSVIAINYSADKRYHDTMLSTHDKIMIPCVFADHLCHVIEKIADAEAILINEGQFFPDLYDVVESLINHSKKRVHICGLDGDFKRKKFGQILDLIPHCDTISKLHAKCLNCGHPGIFSHRVTNETDQVVIGSDNYLPLCRHCYNNSNVGEPTLYVYN
jgi:thymidine kinase